MTRSDLVLTMTRERRGRADSIIFFNGRTRLPCVLEIVLIIIFPAITPSLSFPFRIIAILGVAILKPHIRPEMHTVNGR